MFETTESTPWYRSLAAVIVTSILVPPVGLALLWLRPESTTKSKLLGTLGVLVLASLYIFGYSAMRRPGAEEAQFNALEQHRAQQQDQASAAPGQTATNPVATASTVPGQPGAVAPGTAPESASAHAVRNYWTNLRGPNRDGSYEEMPVMTQWPANGLTPIWKQPVGLGYASFVVADGRAYTIEQRRNQEVATAYDVNTGREIWKQGWNASYSDETGDGPRATPTWDNGRIYALGATGELRSLDGQSGSVIWAKNILSDNGASNLTWAMAASPLVVDDKVIVIPGGRGGKSVVAYNKATGAPVWKSLDDAAAYVSPMLATLGGRRQVVVVTASRVLGIAPENGALIWSHPWDTSSGINCSQPIVVGPNRLFISAGYGKGAALLEISGSGKSQTARVLWENVNMKNKFNSSVVYQGHAYGLDEGILTCVDVNTGERKWKGGRYGYGQLLLANGNLIIQSDNGELILVKATPQQHTELARFQAIQGKSWNVPAIAGGKLLVRNATEMAAYNIAAN